MKRARKKLRYYEDGRPKDDGRRKTNCGWRERAEAPGFSEANRARGRTPDNRESYALRVSKFLTED